MKKIRFLPLIALLLLLALSTTASAAGISGQIPIASVIDAYGAVTTLTDDNAATTWNTTQGGTTLSLNLYGATVGEVWIRSGHCYSQNYYNHYDRPEVVRVTVYYAANRYTTTSDSYRYRLADQYRPNAVSASWNSGYQRLLLPKAYEGVTKVEITVETAISGYGNTGAITISDIILAHGSHATATPRQYATATPRPYVVYVTATPDPYAEEDDLVEYITPDPYWGRDDDDLVELITPEPTEPLVEIITPPPTRTPNVDVIVPPSTTPPLVELITPAPKPTAAPDYPTPAGVLAQLKETIPGNTGPGNWYQEVSMFFGKGDWVNVITKAWDEENGIWWFQLELMDDGEWYRIYTPAHRVDLDPNHVPTEDADIMNPDSRRVLRDHRVYFGPGEEFKMYKVSMLYEGSKADLIYTEKVDGVEWALIHYFDYAVDEDRRGWVPLDVLSTDPFTWN